MVPRSLCFIHRQWFTVFLFSNSMHKPAMGLLLAFISKVSITSTLRTHFERLLPSTIHIFPWWLPEPTIMVFRHWPKFQGIDHCGVYHWILVIWSFYSSNLYANTSLCHPGVYFYSNCGNIIVFKHGSQYLTGSNCKITSIAAHECFSPLCCCI